ncbi:ATP-binding cassette, subfamily B [Halomicrobium zhouii]|uniref:ATP-binding cassette, subfamily B n=1 Tax=Halomicrobium zhouii TaxID=767519 RepID=A0A1I6KR79_9EURY|nr:ABC transporter ATP-binding protein [Halomicrobium zhouii]SFR93420.1 ATP-binding cassette, subfamily B [Halomicrobium zhouii]
MPPGPGKGGDEEFEDLRAEDGNAMVRLFGEYGRGERVRFGVGGLASVFSTLMELLPAFLLGVAIDSFLLDDRAFRLPYVPQAVLPDEPMGQFVLLASILGGSYVMGAALGWVNSWAWNGFAQHFQHAVRVDAYDAMQRRELSFFDDRQTGEVMSILNNDVNQLEGFLTNSLNTGIGIVFRVGGMGAVMLALNWRLGLIPAVIIPALGYASYVFVERIHPKYQSVRSAVGKLNSQLENNLGGIEVVKSYTTEAAETDRVAESSRSYLDAQWDAISTRILFWPTLRLLTAAGYMATFLVGGYWVMVNRGLLGPPLPFFNGPGLTGGLLVTYLLYTRRFMWPMRQFGQIINDYQYAEAAGERIVGLLDTPPGITDADDAADLDEVAGRVEYDDVSFGYQTTDGEQEQVLRDVSFDVEPGEMVGLVGPTGAGKTTLMKLLMRMYDADDGAVRVDGRDVRNVTLRSLRDAVGYVSQEPYLFYGSVRENIGYSRPGATDEEIVAAAKAAGAHEFVVDLQDGYDTTVGERGVKLSGGQRQRVSIARAVLKDPEILILDEATSHVDNETEAVIQDSLRDLVADRTTFAIAHRLSTVRHADTILVLDDGELVERGTHDDLLARDGLYATLWRVQVGEVDALPQEFLDRAASYSPQPGDGDD